MAEAKPASIKEEEIRPEELFAEFMLLSAEDAQNFFKPDEMTAVSCPACGGSEDAGGFKKFGFHYAHCSSCGTVYASPRPKPNALLRYYAESASQNFWSDVILKKTGEKRVQSITLPALNRVETIMNEVVGREPGSVLDVGAANGAFLSEWKNRHPEAELIAVEPGEEPAKRCRDQGMTVYEGFIEDVAGRDGAQADLVTCFEVLEHVQNPQRFTTSLFEATNPGGVSIVSCLGADGFDIQLLWEQSRSIMPPYHLNFLSRDGMENIFTQAGFEKVEILTPGRLDVDIVRRSIERGISVELSRFEKLLLSRGEETLAAFQRFLADNALSSHVWIIAYRGQ